MDYVTDTHSILWYFTEDPRLSKRAFDVFKETVREGFIIIPAVVLAEIMFISKKGRITLTFE
jgi:PIN domain nuclease of toxin-antitoxin system